MSTASRSMAEMRRAASPVDMVVRPTAWLMTQSGSDPSLHLQFPDNREFNREFFDFGPFSVILAPNRWANSMACGKIPYATEQGIFATEQGISEKDQGSCEL
jgi:hypothetical protein